MTSRSMTCLRRWLRLTRDTRGVSAVEFALVLPLMIGLYLGLAEVSQGIGIDRKVALTAHALGDLASQTTTISNAQMGNILDAASAVITPYSATPLAVTVSAINIDASGNAKVGWSDTRGGVAREVGSSVEIPSALAVPNTQLILSEAKYSFTPAIGYVITGTLMLSEKLYMSPRIGAVSRTS